MGIILLLPPHVKCRMRRNYGYQPRISAEFLPPLIRGEVEMALKKKKKGLAGGAYRFSQIYGLKIILLINPICACVFVKLDTFLKSVFLLQGQILKVT